MKTNGSAVVRHSVHDLQSRRGYECTATLRCLLPFRWRLMIAVHGSKSRPPLICQSQPKSIHLQHFTVSFTRWELNGDFVITFAMLCHLFNQSWQFFFFFFARDYDLMFLAGLKYFNNYLMDCREILCRLNGLQRMASHREAQVFTYLVKYLKIYWICWHKNVNILIIHDIFLYLNNS